MLEEILKPEHFMYLGAGIHVIGDLALLGSAIKSKHQLQRFQNFYAHTYLTLQAAAVMTVGAGLLMEYVGGNL